MNESKEYVQIVDLPVTRAGTRFFKERDRYYYSLGGNPERREWCSSDIIENNNHCFVEVKSSARMKEDAAAYAAKKIITNAVEYLLKSLNDRQTP